MLPPLISFTLRLIAGQGRVEGPSRAPALEGAGRTQWRRPELVRVSAAISSRALGCEGTFDPVLHPELPQSDRTWTITPRVIPISIEGSAWRAVEVVGHRLTPARLGLIRVLPRWILVPVITRFMRTGLADAAAVQHAEAAPKEMGLLAKQISAVTQAAGVPTPTWSKLFRAGESTRLSLVIEASS